MRRIPRPILIAALVVALLGVAGLVRGAIPQPAAAVATGPKADPIVVSGAYVRQPALGDTAAAYFTVFNTTGTADVLTAVTSGAGRLAAIHTDAGGSMVVNADGVTVPAHGSVALVAGTGHVMIEGLYGTLAPGQSVNLQLTFQNAGPVVVTAPVIGIYAKAPSS